MNNSVQNQYAPDFVTPPGETLQEILEDRGMTQAELADRTGRPKKTINEIIKGKAAITPETALQFELVLGVPASFWNNREQVYREFLARQAEIKALEEYIPWMRKFPINSMIKLGWLQKHSEPVYQIEELLRYFGVASPIQWQNLWQAAQISYRQSPVFAADPAAVSAWLRRGELEAQKIECASYEENQFREALKEIRHITNQPPDVFIAVVQRLCARAGVAGVFIPEIPGTRTCGATRWLTPTKALIMLSLRYKTDDQLWFTFFHEAGHILIHGKRDIFLEDGEDGSDENREKEEQANQFAANFLIPPEDWNRFRPHGLHYSHEDVLEFASSLGIAAGIIVGRLQHEGKVEPKNLNKLKHRFEWVLPEE
jgi:addiction module HigA family antidote